PDLCQQSLPNFTDQGISTSLISLTSSTSSTRNTRKQIRKPLCRCRCNVEPESAAFGKLHSGDAIQSVNGQKTRQLSHAQASSLIKESGNSLTLIVVKQPGAADSLQHIRPQGKPKFKAPKK
uniref:PDZ domain-containing protein n=1 Tax=Macrostomum lignano TaxID=282301 RepID=A0A1I8G663_9PLAT